MGDSEEDVDYKRSRDKFRTERRGYEGNERGGSPPPGGMRRSGGGDWSRGSWDRRRPYSSDYRRYSPSRGGVGSPPQAKRMRGSDWEERGGGGYYDSHGGDDVHYVRSGPASRNYVGGTGSGATGGGGRNASSGAGSGGDPDAVQPPMMSFKSFLGTQDDSISDEDAVKKFAEYKLEFRRQQLNEFFVHHKDEEW
ncbi:Serrate RNA effector molecule -like protein [Caligus rogercresseyi]|uniref:Serrate RNA effector molecule -like protein n=1 Tax=Caligus rogercresseyi TaxID=217165 RepID=A0A7T8JXJ4_CALRO|nr:Serrate RNA effector molecule -like protein [Caligus rogercresseyi]